MDAAGLSRVEALAVQILSRLKKNYPELDVTLVYSSPRGQTQLGQAPRELLKEFLEMFVESEAKRRALELVREEARGASGGGLIGPGSSQIESALAHVEVDEDVQIECRFGRLRYEAIARLKGDPAVDPLRTSPSGSSIRVVLGTIRSLVAMAGFGGTDSRT